MHTLVEEPNRKIRAVKAQLIKQCGVDSMAVGSTQPPVKGVLGTLSQPDHECSATICGKHV